MIEEETTKTTKSKGNYYALISELYEIIAEYEYKETFCQKLKNKKIDKFYAENSKLTNSDIMKDFKMEILDFSNYLRLLEDKNAARIVESNLLEDELQAALQKERKYLSQIQSLEEDLNIIQCKYADLEQSANEKKEELNKIAKMENITPVGESIAEARFYDVVINIESLRDLKKGWDIIYKTNEGRKSYEIMSKENCCVVGIVGNFNKGKSFILSNISEYSIPYGYSITTQGLSIKYPHNLNKSITLLDSAGFESPLKFIDGVSDESDDGRRITELARDRAHTEIFLQKFILEKSNILLIAVGMMTYSDQKLLNRLRSICNKKRIFVIHNLANLIYIDQVEDYIENTLFKIFRIKKHSYIQFNKENEKKSFNNNYFIDTAKDLNISHVILAKHFSEAGIYYNTTTFDYLRVQMQAFNMIEPFDPIVSLREQIFIKSSEVMEEESRINNICSVVIRDNSIRVETENDIILKKCLVDELGFSRFSGINFTPQFSIIHNLKTNQLIIKIDIPELIKNNFEIFPVQSESYYKVFKIVGEKESDNNIKNPDMRIIENNREFGKFNVEVRLLLPDLEFVDQLPFEKRYENGVVMLVYNLLTPKKESSIGF